MRVSFLSLWLLQDVAQQRSLWGAAKKIVGWEGLSFGVVFAVAIGLLQMKKFWFSRIAFLIAALALAAKAMSSSEEYLPNEWIVHGKWAGDVAAGVFFLSMLYWVSKEARKPQLQKTTGQPQAHDQEARLKRVGSRTRVVEVEPNIVPLEPETCVAHRDDDGVIIEGEKPYFTGGKLWWDSEHLFAITVPYRNRLLEGKDVGEIYDISAQITYRFYDGVTNPYEMPHAAWLSKEESYVDFTLDATHRLIVATLENGGHQKQPTVYGVLRDSFGRKGRETRHIEMKGVLFGIHVSLRSEDKGKVIKNSNFMLEITLEPEFDFALTETFKWKRDKLAFYGLEGTKLIEQSSTVDLKTLEQSFVAWQQKTSGFLSLHLGSPYTERFAPKAAVPPVPLRPLGRGLSALLLGPEAIRFEDRVMAKVKILEQFIDELWNEQMRQHRVKPLSL